jgi:hypothetical protein
VGNSTPTWNANGTYLGIDGKAGFTGSLLDVRIGSLSFLNVNSSHGLDVVNLFTAQGGYINVGSSGLNGFTTNKTVNIAVNNPPMSAANSIQVNVATQGDTATSGQEVALKIAPTYNQSSSTAANTDLLINRTETALGSGAQLFFDAQVAGTSKVSINHLGSILFGGNLTISATAPTISSGFGTSPSIGSGSTAASMDISVGSSPGSSGVISLPTAAHYWVCHGFDQTTPSILLQTAQTTGSATFTNYALGSSSTSSFTASDKIFISCMAH